MKRFAQRAAKMASKSPKASVDLTTSGEHSLSSTCLCVCLHALNDVKWQRRTFTMIQLCQTFTLLYKHTCSPISTWLD